MGQSQWVAGGHNLPPLIEIGLTVDIESSRCPRVIVSENLGIDYAPESQLVTFQKFHFNVPIEFEYLLINILRGTCLGLYFNEFVANVLCDNICRIKK